MKLGTLVHHVHGYKMFPQIFNTETTLRFHGTTTKRKVVSLLTQLYLSRGY